MQLRHASKRDVYDRTKKYMPSPLCVCAMQAVTDIHTNARTDTRNHRRHKLITCSLYAVYTHKNRMRVT